MPAFYKIDRERRIVLSTAAGVVTRADFVTHQARLQNDEAFDPTFSQLADFTQATKVELSPAEVREFAEKNIFSPHSRRAFLVKDDLSYGLARLFGTLRELKGEPGIRVFRELDEALDWLLAKGEAS